MEVLASGFRRLENSASGTKYLTVYNRLNDKFSKTEGLFFS
ncbi:MAG: hypothetical protein ACI8P3_001938, partial [Saprospiraceae bacterium]